MKEVHIHNSDGEEAVLNKFEKFQDIEDSESLNRSEAFLRASKGLFVRNIKFRCHSEEHLSYEILLTHTKNLKFLKRSKTKVVSPRF